MNFSGKTQAEDQFQIAPMIDIIFILLIFFVTSYAVAREEKMLDINLPTAGTAKAEGRSLEDIVVDLNARGDIFLNRKQRTPQALKNRLKRLVKFARDAQVEPGVIIRADGNCAHRYVVRVMDICKSVGISRTMFSTVDDKVTEAVNGE